jgi:hypothetical protein
VTMPSERPGCTEISLNWNNSSTSSQDNNAEAKCTLTNHLCNVYGQEFDQCIAVTWPVE